MSFTAVRDFFPLFSSKFTFYEQFKSEIEGHFYTQHILYLSLIILYGDSIFQHTIGKMMNLENNKLNSYKIREIFPKASCELYLRLYLLTRKARENTSEKDILN